MHLIKNIKTKIVWGWVAAFVFYFSTFLVQFYFDSGAWSRGVFKALAGATLMTVFVYVVVILSRRFFPVKNNGRNLKHVKIAVINKKIPAYVVRMPSMLVGMLTGFLWVDYYKNHFIELAIVVVTVYLTFEFSYIGVGKIKQKKNSRV